MSSAARFENVGCALQRQAPVQPVFVEYTESPVFSELQELERQLDYQIAVRRAEVRDYRCTPEGPVLLPAYFDTQATQRKAGMLLHDNGAVSKRSKPAALAFLS